MPTKKNLTVIKKKDKIRYLLMNSLDFALDNNSKKVTNPILLVNKKIILYINVML